MSAFPSTAQANLGPVRRTESHFQTADGTRLVRRSWSGDDASRCMSIVHGFGEHSARYDAMGEWFARRGFAVHSYDARGHGLSGGHPNYVQHFDEYVDDGMLFLELVREEAAGARHVLVGHSMGGLVVARMLAFRAPAVMCGVLSGAALALPADFSKLKISAVRWLSRILPRFATDLGLPADGLSRDPEVGRVYEADPLVNTNITLSLAAQMFAAQGDPACSGARVEVPVLGLHGADDPICAPAGTESFLSQVTTPHSSCALYPELRHEIFNEPEHEQVWKDVLAFVKRVEEA